ERPTLGLGGTQRSGRSLELEVHEQLHKGEKHHKCWKCEKSFSQRSHLICHWGINTEDWPYECGACGKRFKSSSTLIVHKRIH
ncbi:ZN256 protein, partial [Hirundo rustica]|nr:ZN256 protein [Hirundo rustica]